MSQSANRHQAERWLQTAEEDLRAAQTLLDHGIYAQACFYAQQSGEKAVKALWYVIDADPWGHSVQRLITEFPRQADIPDRDGWIRHGALLDQFYIPTRYPNGLPDLTPGQVYHQEDATRGLEAARTLVTACRQWLTEQDHLLKMATIPPNMPEVSPTQEP
jgi:HEPN domain-containing protein